jgi:hypothetical protein
VSNYTQVTFFAPKDLLITGNPAKLVKGSEVDPEFLAISTAIATKLDKSGDTFFAADGTAGNPSHTFAADTDTGLFRIGTNQLGIVTGGTSAIEVADAAPLGMPIRMGTLAAAPNNQTATYIGVSTSAFTGLNGDLVFIARSSGANVIRFYSGNGGAVTEKVRIENLGQLAVSDGAAGAPAFSFISDPDTGIYSVSANLFRAVVGGVAATSWFNNGGVGQTTSADGTVAAPGLAFTNDTDSGIYRIGADTVGISAGGAVAFALSTANLQSVLKHYFADGTVGAPGLAFANDPDTGFYRDTANQIAIALGGATAGQIAQGTFTATLNGASACNRHCQLSACRQYGYVVVRKPDHRYWHYYCVYHDGSALCYTAVKRCRWSVLR